MSRRANKNGWFGVAALLPWLCATACTAGDTPSNDNWIADGGATLRCPEDSPTRIRGEVRFPNGVLPVAGAFVYPSGDGQAAPRGGTCGQCLTVEGLNYARSEADGSFELTVEPGTQTLIVEKGGFRRAVEVDATACETTVLDIGETRLPSGPREGDTPKIAILTGKSDQLDLVLLRLGLSFETFDVFSDEQDAADGTSPASRFLYEEDRLEGYDMLMVECESNVAELGGGRGYGPLGEASVRERLKQFVADGGRLYATDDAYEVFEAAIPEAVDFLGGEQDGLSSAFEPIDAAQRGGLRGEVMASVHDDAMASWLRAAGALEEDGKLRIADNAVRWTVMERLHEATKSWVTGDVRWRTPEEESERSEGSLSGHLSLTVTAEQGCGRGFVSSYHTASGNVSGRAFLGQELVLAYTILAVGDCVEEPVLY